jgi:hypothetical protein
MRLEDKKHTSSAIADGDNLIGFRSIVNVLNALISRRAIFSSESSSSGMRGVGHQLGFGRARAEWHGLAAEDWRMEIVTAHQPVIVHVWVRGWMKWRVLRSLSTFWEAWALTGPFSAKRLVTYSQKSRPLLRQLPKGSTVAAYRHKCWNGIHMSSVAHRLDQKADPTIWCREGSTVWKHR